MAWAKVRPNGQGSGYRRSAYGQKHVRGFGRGMVKDSALIARRRDDRRQIGEGLEVA